MKTVLSTAVFPNIEYMVAVASAGEVWIEKFETYQRQSYRNRFYIGGPNGKQMMVVPVIRPQGNHSPVHEVIPDNRLPWERNHLRAIETAYNRSAFFLYYRDVTEAMFNTQGRSLLEWNTHVLNHLLEILRIDALIHYTEQFLEDYEQALDFRNSIHPKKASPVFKSPIPEYFQPFMPKFGFQPNLSILDLIYNEGPQAGKYIKELASSLHTEG